MNISVITTLNCSVDAEEALQIELKKLILASLAEEGCLSYEIYECNDEKGQYIITELWESEDALNAHKLSPHYKYFVHIAPALLKDPIEIKSLNRLI